MLCVLLNRWPVFIPFQSKQALAALSSRDSSVSIATRYGLDGPGIESRWRERFSRPVQTDPGAQAASCTVATGSLTLE